jgi:hypothetical protein
VDQDKSTPSLLTASESFSARERGQLPGIPGLDRDDQGRPTATTYLVPGRFLKAGKNELASTRMALPSWNVRATYNDLAFQNERQERQTL